MAQWLKDSYSKARKAVLDLSDEEALVEEATNEEPWGPHGQTMSKIADATHSRDMEKFSDIMRTLWRRIAEGTKPGGNERWRRSYKGLLVVDHLLKHGSTRCVDEISRQTHVIETLYRFKFVDDKQRDQGLNVREKAKKIGELLQDTDRLKAERQRARENKSKYSGMSSVDYRSGGLGGGGYTRPSTQDGGRIASQGFGSSSAASGGSSSVGGSNSNDIGASPARRAGATSGAEDDEALRAYKAQMAAKRAAAAGGAAPAPAPAQAPAAPLPDLIGGFDEAPVAAAPPQEDLFAAAPAVAPPVPPPSAAAVPKLAPPGGAAAAAPAVDNSWGAFDSAPNAGAPAAAADPFAPAPSAPAPAPAPSGNPLGGLEDLFGGMSTGASGPAPAPAAAPTAVPALDENLFSSVPQQQGMGSMPPAQQQQQQQGFAAFGGGTPGGNAGMGMGMGVPTQQSIGVGTGMGMPPPQPPPQQQRQHAFATFGGQQVGSNAGMGMGMPTPHMQASQQAPLQQDFGAFNTAPGMSMGGQPQQQQQQQQRSPPIPMGVGAGRLPPTNTTMFAGHSLSPQKSGEGLLNAGVIGGLTPQPTGALDDDFAGLYTKK